MDINKVLESLGVDKLDESKQNEVKEKFDTLVETKVDEGVKEKEDEIRQELTETYENKFEEYKKDITEKFSDFLDEVLEEEMEIPDKVKEYARKGELYEDVIETLKTRMAIDEGHIDGEVKDLLRESKDKIAELKEQVNDLTSKHMETRKDAKELAANVYLREKCEGLTVKEQEKVLNLLEGVTDKEQIDKKFDVIVESAREEENKDGKELNEDGTGKETTDSQLQENQEPQNDPFSNMKSYWLNIMNETASK